VWTRSGGRNARRGRGIRVALSGMVRLASSRVVCRSSAPRCHKMDPCTMIRIKLDPHPCPHRAQAMGLERVGPCRVGPVTERRMLSRPSSDLLPVYVPICEYRHYAANVPCHTRKHSLGCQPGESNCSVQDLGLETLIALNPRRYIHDPFYAQTSTLPLHKHN
jgi:hypothetical protein